MLYCSPERVNNKTNIYKEDVWAFGVILYQMSSFMHPFNLELKSKKTNEILFPIHKKIEERSPELNGLIDAML
jgi:serine/threonine protein kinase